MFIKKFKKYRFNKKRTFIFLFMFVALLGLSLGYAFLTTRLTFTGTSKIASSKWDVHFENLAVIPGSVDAVTPATLEGTTTVRFTARIEKPGDFYAFTVDVANRGTIDAVLDGFEISPALTEAQKKYLTYTVTYPDDTEVFTGTELNVNDVKTLKVVMRYETCEDDAEYPQTEEQFDISVKANFIQK